MLVWEGTWISCSLAYVSQNSTLVLSKNHHITPHKNHNFDELFTPSTAWIGQILRGWLRALRRGFVQIDKPKELLFYFYLYYSFFLQNICSPSRMTFPLRWSTCHPINNGLPLTNLCRLVQFFAWSLTENAFSEGFPGFQLWHNGTGHSYVS